MAFMMHRFVVSGLLALVPLQAQENPAFYLHVLNDLSVVRDLKVHLNLAYGTESRQQLDVYSPRKGDHHPVMVFVHGGSWTGYDKSYFKFVGESFARAGYVTALINYRLAPQTTYPGFVQDTAKSLKWVKDHIQDYQGDPQNVFVMGHSAGAYNVVTAMVQQGFLQAEGLKATDFRGVIGIAGPYDFDPIYTPGVFGKMPRPEVMPANNVQGDLPPFLLLVAGNDQLVGPENGISMEKALQAHGTPVQMVTIPGVNHGEIVAALMRRFSGFFPPVRQLVLDFMQKTPKS